MSGLTLTGLAVIMRGPRYLPYAWVFVVVFVALIVLLFVAVYGRGNRSRRRTKNHGHRAASNRAISKRQPKG